MIDENEKPDWLIVDGLNLVFRGWWAVKDLQTSTGRKTGVEYGLIKSLLYLVRRWYPARIVLVWDGHPTEEPCEGYKAGRDHSKHHEENFYERAAEIREVLRPLISTVYDPAIEADYLAAPLTRCLPGVKYLLSNDDDWLGLVDDKLKVRVVKPPLKNHVGERIYDEERQLAENKVPPNLWALYRAFDGDISDNLPGVKRVSAENKLKAVEGIDPADKPFAQLIDLVIQNATKISTKIAEKYEAHREQALNNYRLSDLRGRRWLTLSNITCQLRMNPTLEDVEKVKDYCRQLEFTTVINRLEWNLFTERRDEQSEIVLTNRPEPVG